MNFSQTSGTADKTPAFDTHALLIGAEFEGDNPAYFFSLDFCKVR